ncbi:hypothetical protein DH2020_031805 [Rehmannia glutinosa]|uniref:Transmembrane protein n=1 Tax=Rehmannia glutinosa TaxID=99300 RepID=A0ABR0VIM9_REHGL
MDSVKNRGRIKFFPCFNPIVDVVDEDEPCSHSPPSPGVDESRRREKTGHGRFSGLVKAVFFKTPLLKKLRSKRSKRDSFRSSSNISSSKLIKKLKKKKQSREKYSDQEEIFQDNSDRSSLFSSTSSSSASSISSNSRPGSERIKTSSTDCFDSKQTNITNNKPRAMKTVISSKCDYTSAKLMLIILVCLVALVFWGKAFAIVTCTSAWLFWAPSRAGPRGGGPTANNVVGSEEDKKRVVMEGFLDRNRSRVVQ